MRKVFYWLGVGIVLAYPVVSAFDSLKSYGWLQKVLLVAAIVAVVVLIIVEGLERGDEKDASRVLQEGLSNTGNELEELLLAPPRARQNKFDQLGKVATNAIAGLAEPERTQAQLFWVHDHDEHQHLVSIHASNGKKRSQITTFRRSAMRLIGKFGARQSMTEPFFTVT